MDLTFPLPSQTEPSFPGEKSKEHLSRDPVGLIQGELGSVGQAG